MQLLQRDLQLRGATERRIGRQSREAARRGLGELVLEVEVPELQTVALRREARNAIERVDVAEIVAQLREIEVRDLVDRAEAVRGERRGSGVTRERRKRVTRLQVPGDGTDLVTTLALVIRSVVRVACEREQRAVVDGVGRADRGLASARAVPEVPRVVQRAAARVA